MFRSLRVHEALRMTLLITRGKFLSLNRSLRCTVYGCCLLLLSNNRNIVPSWILCLEKPPQLDIFLPTALRPYCTKCCLARACSDLLSEAEHWYEIANYREEQNTSAFTSRFIPFAVTLVTSFISLDADTS